MRFLPIRAPNTKTAWEAYQPGLTADNWESYTEQTSMATAVCAYGAEAFPMFEKNGVSLEAYPDWYMSR